MTNETKNLLSNYIESFKERVKSKVPFNSPIKDAMYAEAVRLAYFDAKRALKGITSTPEREADKANALTQLALSVKEYFLSDDSFDHKHFCDAFISGFNDYEMTYGAAQKIVNLTFKYLYCFESFRCRYYHKFKDCQMVLDSYILSWFKRNVDLQKVVNIGAFETWSGMRDYNRYSSIQALIKSFVERKGQGMTVLEYEFILWPNTLIYEAAVSWESTLEGVEKSEIYKKFPFRDLDDLVEAIGASCSKKSKNDAKYLF